MTTEALAAEEAPTVDVSAPAEEPVVADPTPSIGDLSPEEVALVLKSRAPAKEEEPKVLDLTTMAPNRRLAKLPTKANPKGETFELRLLDDFGIALQQQLLSRSRRFEQLFNKEEDLETDEQERLKFLLDWVFVRVLDAPDEIKADMPDAVRSRVVTGFSLAPLLARQEEAQEQMRTDVFERLKKKGYVTQEQLDEILADLESEKQTSES